MHAMGDSAFVTARIAEENERRRLQKEKEERARRKKNQRIAIVVSSAAAVVIAVVLLLTMVIIPTGKYNDAVALLEGGNYAEAMDALDELGDFKDSQQLYTDAFRGMKSQYRTQADAYLAQGDVINAAIYYQKAGEHVLAKNTFDFNTRFAVDEYIIAGIMSDGSLRYQSNGQYDQKENAATDLQGAVALVSHTTDGINGLDAQGRLLTHAVSYMDRIEIRDSMEIEKYSGIRQVYNGINNTYFIAMLLEDGNVVCTSKDHEQDFPAIRQWKNIRELQEHYEYLLGIDTDGKVHIAYAAGEDGKHDENVAS